MSSKIGINNSGGTSGAFNKEIGGGSGGSFEIKVPHNFKHLMDDLLLETDKMALIDCKYGTLEYELQQDMIRAAARYRLSVANKDK